MRKVQIGNCTIYHGDCMEMLPSIAPGSIDAVWVDPPFGISYVPNSRKTIAIPDRLTNDEKPHLEFIPPIVKTIKDGGAVYLCTRFDVAAQWGTALQSAGAKVKNPIYWIKNVGSKGDLTGDRSNCVEIVLFAHIGRHLLRGKRTTNAWTIPRPEILYHPTPKPLELVRRCIQASSAPGDLILDPCLGSGTTAIACALMGRRFIGAEIDNDFFDLACERIEQAYRDVENRLPGFEPLALERQCALFD